MASTWKGNPGGGGGEGRVRERRQNRGACLEKKKKEVTAMLSCGVKGKKTTTQKNQALSVCLRLGKIGLHTCDAREEHG